MEQTAKELLATLKDNKTLNELAKTIKIGPYTIKQLIEDATDGMRNLTKITAKEYTEIMNAFYQMVISGDYDLDNISQSLKDAFEKAFGGLDKNIDLGDKVINLKYNTVITKKDGKYYTSKGTEYKTLEDA
jgi:flagellar motor switch protein FliG